MRRLCAFLALLALAALPTRTLHAQPTPFTNGQAASAVLGKDCFIVSGANAPCPAANSLSGPQGVAVDLSSGQVYVADTGNNRVLRYPSTAALTNGGAADRVFGQPDFITTATATTATGMNGPEGVALDGSGRLYVADANNNRVLRFGDAGTGSANGPTADRVFGQATFTTTATVTTATGMNNPRGVAVDASGRLYVADAFNIRVLRFDDAGTGSVNGPAADRVFGQATFTTSARAVTATGMLGPYGVAVDASGRLYVADVLNNRVLRFDGAGTDTTNGPAADRVFGQPRFTSSTTATTATGINGPYDVAVDASGRLYVADRFNSRVLRFDGADTAPANGPAADGVLGQGDFTSSAVNQGRLSSVTLNRPEGVAVDPSSGQVYVADWGNNRVLRYASTAALTSGTAADRVFGQADFTTSTTATTATGMNGPHDVAVDGSGRLYVADASNHRVLRFDDAGTGTTSAPAADRVFGQVGFTVRAFFATTATSMNRPGGVAVDRLGRLYVADGANSRVLRFDAPGTGTTNGPAADGVLGQATFTSRTSVTTATGIGGPHGLAVDNARGRLYVADVSSSRVLVFQAVAGTVEVVADVPVSGLALAVLSNASASPSVRVSVGDAAGGAVTVEVIDVLGRVVRRESASGAESVVSLGGLSSGVYVVRASEGARVATATVVVR